MKKHFLRALFYVVMVFTIGTNAQTIIPIEQLKNYSAFSQEGKYFKDVNCVLNKFLGTWKYQDAPTNPTKILEVTFYITREITISNHTEDCLYAHYKYIENGVTIFDTYPRGSETQIYLGSFWDPLNTNKYHLRYGEPAAGSKALTYNFNIEYLPVVDGVEKLKWDVEVVFEIAEGAILPRIPQHIVLVKQL